MESGDYQLTSSVQHAAEQMAADYGVVPPSEIGMEMQVDLSVLFGDVAHEAGDLHLLLEGLVDVFLGGGVQETEDGMVDRSNPADFAAEDSLFLAESGQGAHDLLMVVYADDILVAVLNE